MRGEALLSFLAFSAINDAAPVSRANAPAQLLHVREVPQEHSHNVFLDSVRTSLAANNPDNIQDPVFGLLGNAAAAAGQGSISNTDCLHQATADQAFTNAKVAGDVKGMTDALVYAALERNTGKDPASPGAAAKNKAVTLALAQQIASIGGDPQQALKSGTFAPGDVNDATAKGNTCDTANDEPGCIFTQKLLVEDATAEEINAAVAGGTPAAGSLASGSGAANSTAAQAVNASPAAAASTSSDLSDVAASPNKAVNASTEATPPASVCDSTTPSAAPITSSSTTSNNIQTFTGTLGGAPPPVTSSASSRPFSVNGATFLNAAAALQRSCSIQHNSCANAANSGTLPGGVAQCDTQENACNSASSPQKKHKRALDLGSCTDPSIKFANGLDGRTEPAFAPVDTVDFNHGSALNIGVISAFICQQLADKRKAGADATAACAKGEVDAAKVTGQAAAEAFNAVFASAAAVSGTCGPA
ncbi:MAG: hypothetical protein Q9195_002322 [Heterodermia aff. obscurata]